MLTVYRQEIKYVISRIEATQLIHRLDGLLTMDEHGDHGRYIVRSQYFDSLGDRDFYENLDGLMNRSKIRIRTYPIGSFADYYPESVKLEHKCKSGADSMKYSLPITPEEALLMERGSFTFLSRFDGTPEEETARILQSKCLSEIYRPSAIVSYTRRAFFYPLNDVRITFDYDLETTLSPYGLLDYSKSLTPVTDSDRIVLEVKFNRFLPQFIKDALRDIDRSQSANSKYALTRLFIR